LTISAKTSAVPVIIGGGFAYAVCALLAVIVGKLLSKYLSDRVMSLIGGIVFLAFGIITAIWG
jgi:putative Ca2+/H+ antiporter (TMEM165/GDT1 family)